MRKKSERQLGFCYTLTLQPHINNSSVKTEYVNISLLYFKRKKMFDLRATYDKNCLSKSRFIPNIQKLSLILF